MTSCVHASKLKLSRQTETKRTASGFTLIELIIVIVILGILAVTVAPQFFNFGSDARAATVRGLEGALNTSVELVHARAQIENQVSPNASELEMPDGREIVVINGYPGMLGTAVDDVTELVISFLNIDPDDWEYGVVTTGGTGARIAPKGRNGEQGAGGLWDITNCYVEYLIPTASEQRPTIRRNEAGC